MKYLFEIGTEELPAVDVWVAVEQLNRRAPHIFKSQEIEVSTGDIEVYATPRRLALLADNSSYNTLDPKGLEEVSASLVKSLSFEKSMRWIPQESLSFSRPIRWMVALLDDQLLNVEYAGVKSDRVSYGPRFLGSMKIKIDSANSYLTQLKEHRVIVDQKVRRKEIVDQMEKLAAEVSGCVSEDEELLAEVTQLVEYPTAVLGNFDERFLKIPREVAITVMKKHQRYFAVEDDGGGLLPYFITIANQLPQNSKLIAQGNEKVVEARLSDGEFFYYQDRQHKLEHFVAELSNITFHEKLGTVYDKSERLEEMAKFLPEILGLDKDDKFKRNLARAAHLAKADLATALVTEFSDLQGTIGRIYALEDSEDEAVAAAIEEHYLPRFSGDKLPQTLLGKVLAIGDRIDTLAGFFAVGLKPSGSQDPYALRRGALGLAQILVTMKTRATLEELFKLANQFLPVELEDSERVALIEFVQERIRADLKETGVEDNLVKAVLASSWAQSPYLVYMVAREVSERQSQEEFKNLAAAAKRVGNIVEGEKVEGPVKENLFQEDAESNLYQAYQTVAAELKKLDADEVGAILEIFSGLTGPIDNYFDEVMVMTEDENLRRNRLALLTAVDRRFNTLINFQSL